MIFLGLITYSTTTLCMDLARRKGNVKIYNEMLDFENCFPLEFKKYFYANKTNNYLIESYNLGNDNPDNSIFKKSNSVGNKKLVVFNTKFTNHKKNVSSINCKKNDKNLKDRDFEYKKTYIFKKIETLGKNINIKCKSTKINIPVPEKLIPISKFTISLKSIFKKTENYLNQKIQKTFINHIPYLQERYSIDKTYFVISDKILNDDIIIKSVFEYIIWEAEIYLNLRETIKKDTINDFLNAAIENRIIITDDLMKFQSSKFNSFLYQLRLKDFNNKDHSKSKFLKKCCLEDLMKILLKIRNFLFLAKKEKNKNYQKTMHNKDGLYHSIKSWDLFFHRPILINFNENRHYNIEKRTVNYKKDNKKGIKKRTNLPDFNDEILNTNLEFYDIFFENKYEYKENENFISTSKSCSYKNPSQIIYDKEKYICEEIEREGYYEEMLNQKLHHEAYFNIHEEIDINKFKKEDNIYEEIDEYMKMNDKIEIKHIYEEIEEENIYEEIQCFHDQKKPELNEKYMENYSSLSIDTMVKADCYTTGKLEHHYEEIPDIPNMF